MLNNLYNSMREKTPRKWRKRLKEQSWFNPLTKFIFGTGVYSQNYYEDVERIEAKSVPVIAAWIKEQLSPNSLIDIGCGPGHMMASLQKVGIKVFGLDISDAALDRTKAKGLVCERHDLTDPNQSLSNEKFDLAVSCEVAEHLEKQFAPIFVQKLANAAPVVFLTAAEPQPTPGLHHFNEQPNQYWIDLMKEAGQEFDVRLTNDARKTFQEAGVISYLAKPMIFRRKLD